MARGAVNAYLEKEFGGPFTIRETDVTVGTAAASVVGNSPDRTGLIVINVGVNVATVGWRKGLAAGTGILLNASGGSLTMNVRDDFVLPSWELFCIGAAASTLYVVEIVRYDANK